MASYDLIHTSYQQQIVRSYVVWQKSNETDFLLTMNLILFTNQRYLLQNSSLGRLHSDGGVVSIVRRLHFLLFSCPVLFSHCANSLQTFYLGCMKRDILVIRTILKNLPSLFRGMHFNNAAM